MKKLVRIFCIGILFAGTLGITGLVVYRIYTLGQIRYFDIDEAAYLSWALRMLRGERPYVDFFLYPPPGFLWFLTLFVPKTAGFDPALPFLWARAGMSAVFFALSLATGFLLWTIRKSWVWVIVPFLLLTLPVPFDKFIEIRPDALAYFFAILGIVFQAKAMEAEDQKRKRKREETVFYFLSGICYAVSLPIFTKTLIIVGWAWIALIVRFVLRIKHGERIGKALKSSIPFCIGFFSVLFLFFLRMLSLGNFGLVWYSLTKLPVEGSKVGIMFPMPDNFGFLRNELYYGTWGFTLGWYVNAALWTVGMVVLGWRLVTLPVRPIPPWVRSTEAIILCSFVSFFVFFRYFSAMKHLQYLIPIAMFLMLYAADGVASLWLVLQKSIIGIIVFCIVWGAIIFMCYRSFVYVTAPKFNWVNVMDLFTVRRIVGTIPSSEYVLDLVGYALYHKQPYYVSSLPVGQMEPFLSRPLPSLREALARTDTKYIYQGSMRRIGALNLSDQAYILDLFKPVGTEELYVRRDMYTDYVKKLPR